jgi:hypothetical protein
MTEQSQEVQPLQGRIPAWVKRVVPVLVSALILWYYFRDQDWKALWNAMGQSILWLAIAAIVVPQVFFWFMETLIVERHFRWFHGPFPFWTYFWVRGAMYILMFINPVLGGGGIVMYLQRKADITWRKFGGILLFRFGLTLWGVCIIMIPTTLAMHYYKLDEQMTINMYAWWGLLIFGIVYMINSWSTWRRGTHFGISKYVVRDRESEFWTAFRTATTKQWLQTWAMALPPFFLTLIGFYFLVVAYRIDIPFLKFMILAPLFFVVMDLPIAFAGFGTATMAWNIFFPGQGSPDQVAALTLFLPFARAACRALIGVISLKPAVNDISGLFGESDDAPRGKEATIDVSSIK